MLEIKYIKRFNEAVYLKNKLLFYDILSDSEIADIEKYKLSKRKIEHLTGIVLSRIFVSKILSISAKEVQFELGENGKPFCKSHPEIHFNISHGGDYIVAAFADVSVGVDVESWKRKPPMEVARRFFSATEFQQLDSVSRDEKPFLFYKFWTAKESYLKMLGTGLTKSLSTFSVSFKQEKTTIFDEEQSVSCYVSQFQPDPSHIISACTENQQNIQYQEIIIDDILQIIEHGKQ